MGSTRDNTETVLRQAADCLSEDGENIEFDSAIVQLTARLVGMDTPEGQDAVRAILRLLKDANDREG